MVSNLVLTFHSRGFASSSSKQQLPTLNVIYNATSRKNIDLKNILLRRQVTSQSTHYSSFWWHSPNWCKSSSWVSEQCFTSPPTQYRLYWRRFLQVKRSNQQYQSTEGNAIKENTYAQTIIYTKKDIHKISTTSPLVYTNMGWVGESRVEGRVARPERRWGCHHGTPKSPSLLNQSRNRHWH